MTNEERDKLIEKVIWLIEDSYYTTVDWSHEDLVTNIKRDLQTREEELSKMFD